MTHETVAVAVDHGGYALKHAVVDELREAGCEVLDLGADGADPVDYPGVAARVVAAVAGGAAGKGVLICGTGIGMSIAANRDGAVRAALCYDEETARMARRHNDANVICMGGRKTGEETARAMIRLFLATPFDGGRHARRVATLGGGG